MAPRLYLLTDMKSYAKSNEAQGNCLQVMCSNASEPRNAALSETESKKRIYLIISFPINPKMNSLFPKRIHNVPACVLIMPLRHPNTTPTYSRTTSHLPISSHSYHTTTFHSLHPYSHNHTTKHAHNRNQHVLPNPNLHQRPRIRGNLRPLRHRLAPHQAGILLPLLERAG